MKALVIFVDMERVDHMNIYNPQAPVSLLDKRLCELGGTIFTRCYSPSPDTPRSLACMQTGLLPYFNGCDTRIKWPKYFIKDGVTTIWDHAVSKGYKVNLCCNKSETITGFFRYEESDEVQLFHTPQSFFEGGDFSDGTLSFIGIPDMHTAIGDYKATNYAFKKGDEVVDSYFEKYLTSDFISHFDYTFIFSDHGFQLENERAHMTSKLDLLDDGRSQLLMMVHKKGDKELKKDNRLASIVDLYASLEEVLGCGDYRHGFSLMDEPKRTITHIEDHQDFNVYPEIMIKQWRVITEDYDIKTDAKTIVVMKGNKEDFNSVDSYLREFSPKYAEYVKQLEVWKYYDSLKSDDNHSHTYFIGSERAGSLTLFAIKVFYKLKKTLHL